MVASVLVGAKSSMGPDATQATIIKTDGRASSFKLRDYFKDDVGTVDPTLAADYSGYMDGTMKQIVGVVTDIYDFGRHRYLLDVCGGPGTFCKEILAKYPSLRAGVLDVPAVADIARKKLEGTELAERLDIIGGDAFNTPFDRRADCITMCRAAHDWDDERVRQIARRACETLPRGGRFVVIERMIPDEFDPRAEPLYIRAVYFLAKSETACYRTARRYLEIFREVGFASTFTVDPKRDPYEFFQGLRIVVGEKS